MIYGNTVGIKKVLLQKLEDLQADYDKNLFIDREVLSFLAEVTSRINRELCVYVSRGGTLMAVGIGDSATVPLKYIDLKRGTERFSGVRCIHTHPNGSGKLSELDLSALKNLRLDCMCAVGVDNGYTTDVSVAFMEQGEPKEYRYANVGRLPDGELLKRIVEQERAIDMAPKAERAGNVCVLVNVARQNGERSLIELQSLAKTAGLNVVDSVLQNRDAADKVFCVGKGKLDEIAAIVQNRNVDYVVFNNALNGSQLYALEEALGIKVMDRTMLILEIFSRHAESQEGKLQVELARLKYTLPKLMGQGKALSRIGGGSGGGAYTKGSGETKLETDRRHIRRTIFELSERLEKLKAERNMRRSRREKTGVKTVAIVGYTNAGKSTLMNAMTKANVKAEDKLFATLDPVTRRVFVDIGKEYLLTDTVGFIDDLPHELVEAFHSTLDETRFADLLLHVVDVSNPDYMAQYDVVGDVLEKIGAGGKPTVVVYNKIDQNTQFIPPVLIDSVAVSAKSGENLDELRQLVASKLFGTDTPKQTS